MLRPQVFRAGAVARLLSLLAIAAPVLWYRDTTALLVLTALGLVWAYQTVAELRPGLVLRLAPIAEASLVGVVCGFGLVYSPALLAALAVPPFVAVLFADLRAMMLSLAAQLTFTVGTALACWSTMTPDQAFAIFTWTLAALGLGLIGNFAKSPVPSDPDPLLPYHDAQGLIRQLIAISGDLSSGLDLHTLGGQMLSTVSDELPTATLALYVPRGETMTPVVTTSTVSQHDLGDCETLAAESWASAAPVTDDRAFAFPVGESAVVAGVLRERDQDPEFEPAIPFERLARLLAPSAVKLDTALLFSEFRDSASADERQRLAREMHDGIAQDIASLGYLVDALAANPASPEQAGQLSVLRERVTTVVAEVRQSVLTLRTSIGESESLGTAIGSIARHLSEASAVPIQVTLDEQATRLRPEVEAELFRITQEAMNNALKHAHASKIEVHCQVHAPSALITVTDDGRGLQQGGRHDSHGLTIMRERARLINAQLSMVDNAGGGLTVSVRLGRLGRATGDSDETVTAKVTT